MHPLQPCACIKCVCRFFVVSTIAKISAPEKTACILPLSEDLADAGLSGEPLEGTFEEIRKLVSVLK